MKRGGRVTFIAIVVGVILLGVARAIWSYAQIQSLALILTFVAVLIAIGVEALLTRLAQDEGAEPGPAARGTGSSRRSARRRRR
jgi:hypothetical protein